MWGHTAVRTEFGDTRQKPLQSGLKSRIVILHSNKKPRRAQSHDVTAAQGSHEGLKPLPTLLIVSNR